jgi:hypothetical protein
MPQRVAPKVAALAITMAIKPAIRPYSTAVAAESSAAKRAKSFFIRLHPSFPILDELRSNVAPASLPEPHERYGLPVTINLMK